MTYRVGDPYPPKRWPQMVTSAAAGAAIAAVFIIARWSIWIELPCLFISGYVITDIRWRLFKKSHPLKTPEQYLEDRRNAAPWN